MHFLCIFIVKELEMTCMVFFYKQSKFQKKAGACLRKKPVQAQSMVALCLFIKILLSVCLGKRLDQAYNTLFYKNKM